MHPVRSCADTGRIVTGRSLRLKFSLAPDAQSILDVWASPAAAREQHSRSISPTGYQVGQYQRATGLFTGQVEFPEVCRAQKM